MFKRVLIGLLCSSALFGLVVSPEPKPEASLAHKEVVQSSRLTEFKSTDHLVVIKASEPPGWALAFFGWLLIWSLRDAKTNRGF